MQRRQRAHALVIRFAVAEKIKEGQQRETEMQHETREVARRRTAVRQQIIARDLRRLQAHALDLILQPDSVARQDIIQMPADPGFAQPRPKTVQAAGSREARHRAVEALRFVDKMLGEPYRGQYYPERDDNRDQERGSAPAVDAAIKFDQRGMGEKREQDRPRNRHQKRFEDLVQLPGDQRKEAEEENLYDTLPIHHLPPSRSL